MFNTRSKKPEPGGDHRGARSPRPAPIGASAPVPTREPDRWLMFFVITLVIIGTLAIYDASYVKAGESKSAGYNPAFYLVQQLKWVAIGSVAFLIGMNIGYWNIRRFAPMGMLLAIAGLVLVLIPGIGDVAGGARRWIDLGPIRFQPSEIAKIALVFYMAHFLVLNRKHIGNLKEGFLPALLPIGLVSILIMFEPDMGTMLATAGVSVALLFVGGARVKHVLGLIAAAAVMIFAMAVREPYRLRRLLVYIDPFSDPENAGYQIVQGLFALGSGGPLGVGIGESRAKWLYLPAEHTDFIFAIIGEELGLLGSLIILTLFLGLLRRGFVISGKCRNPFGSLLALGISMTIAMQALMNISVVSTLIPATGVPLPLISYGGTSLVLTLFALGVLADISRRPVLPWENNEEHEGRTNRRWDRGAHLSGVGDRRGARSIRRNRTFHR